MDACFSLLPCNVCKEVFETVPARRKNELSQLLGLRGERQAICLPLNLLFFFADGGGGGRDDGV